MNGFFIAADYQKQLGPCGMLLAEFMVSPPLAAASVAIKCRTGTLSRFTAQVALGFLLRRKLSRQLALQGVILRRACRRKMTD